MAFSPSAARSGGRSAAARHLGKFEQLKNGRRVFPREVTRTTMGLLHFSQSLSVGSALNLRIGWPSLFNFIVNVHSLVWYFTQCRYAPKRPTLLTTSLPQRSHLRPVGCGP